MNKSFVVSSWNVDGLKTKFESQIQKSPPNVNAPKSTISLESWFDENDPAIACFQETKWQKKYDKTQQHGRPIFSLPEYKFYHHISRINSSRSLAICVHESVRILEVQNQKVRILGDGSLKAQVIRFHAPKIGVSQVYNIYLPPVKANSRVPFFTETVEELLKCVSIDIRRSKRKGVRIFVCGDFNSYNPQFGPYVLSKLTAEERRRVEAEEEFLNACNLKGTVFDSPTRCRKNSSSFLDRFFYSHDSSLEFVQLGLCLNGLGSPTVPMYPDHRPILAHLIGQKPVFKPSDRPTIKWGKITEYQWKDISTELILDLQSRWEWYQKASQMILLSTCLRSVRRLSKST